MAFSPSVVLHPCGVLVGGSADEDGVALVVEEAELGAWFGGMEVTGGEVSVVGVWLTDAVGVGFGVAVAVVELSLILTVDGVEVVGRFDAVGEQPLLDDGTATVEGVLCHLYARGAVGGVDEVTPELVGEFTDEGGGTTAAEGECVGGCACVVGRDAYGCEFGELFVVGQVGGGVDGAVVLVSAHFIDCTLTEGEGREGTAAVVVGQCVTQQTERHGGGRELYCTVLFVQVSDVDADVGG